jgi:hypothetical protein
MRHSNTTYNNFNYKQTHLSFLPNYSTSKFSNSFLSSHLKLDYVISKVCYKKCHIN